MRSLRKVYYYNRHGEKKLNAYNICISKKEVAAAGFDDKATFEVSAEKGKIYIEQIGGSKCIRN